MVCELNVYINIQQHLEVWSVLMLVLNNFRPSHIAASAFSSKSSQDITVPVHF